MFIGLVSVVVLAAAYPVFADSTQHPLAIFILPVLVTAALSAWRATAVVALASVSVAAIEGLAESELDSSSLIARLITLVTGGFLGVFVAWQRGRRQVLIDDAKGRALMSEMFQVSLAPVPVPPEGIIAEMRFIPGDDRLHLGGDFIDAIRLPTGHLGYVIGDVCGHGPRAAAFGAAVRSGWKTLATELPNDPDRWVHGLEAAFFRLGRHTDTFVTLNTGILELDGRRLCYVSAGHPWPIVLAERPILLEPNVGPPLGVGSSGTWQQSEMVMPTGGTLLLYTDGLTENSHPGKRRTGGERRLLDYLMKADGNVDLDDLLRYFGPDGFDDDVAILTLKGA